ncbi:MYXO-CTERM sorting domain-containing protein [Pyxidicoccus xibeiensis]|uniref:MYXO-CTERM sorting domain-containing protein n=1 Tax=Pyxidicoccus xibeiensis TaxID=2906759 RepID=UPI0020A8129C|nr:MYXO-CTERM sorting domain-containing protein [Pyxidicoccus xibeiensis]MCP3142247.1 MYXO-CTERM sorting domain-containing protein [Pyxidicoccus xibeiensis]
MAACSEGGPSSPSAFELRRQALAPLSPVKLKALASGESVTQVLAFDGGVLVGVDTATTALEVWRSTGTVGSTLRIHLAVPQEDGSVSLTRFRDSVLFTSANELWSTDGTGVGTVRVKAALPDAYFKLTPLGSSYVFMLADYGSKALWQTDGTEPGTRAVEGFPSGVNGLAISQGRAWFNAPTGVMGVEPHITDGTPGGTRILKDINEGPRESFATDFVPMGGLTYFRATDRAAGSELWKSDGTADGTQLVVNMGPGDTVPIYLFPWKGHVYFWPLGIGWGTRLYRSDGTANGTELVSSAVSYGQGEREFVGWGDFLFFAATAPSGDVELWRTDGTSQGTVLVADLNPGNASSNPASLMLMSEMGPLVFTATTPETGRELWRLDGPLETPTLASDVASGTASSSPANLTVAGTDLYFTANDGTSGGLFKLSGLLPGTEADAGTDAGTELDAGLPPEDGGVELDAGVEDAGMELDAGVDAGTEPDAGPLPSDSGVDAGTEQDAGPLPSDAGTTVDAGTPDAGTTQDAGVADAGTQQPPPDESGCSCQSTSSSVPWGLALMGLFFSARRRARTR